MKSVERFNVLRLSISLQLLPRVLLRVHHWRYKTGVLSSQMSLELSIRPREIALVHRTAPRSRVHEPPRGSRLHRPVNLSSAVRTFESLAAGLLVSAVLLEAVGVAGAGVAHVSTTSFGEGRALQEDGIVRRLHADDAPHILPFTHTL